MKIFSASVVLILALSACSSLRPGCVIEKQAVSIASSAITTQLECSNPDAVLASVTAAMQKLNLCPASGPMMGPVSDRLCPIISQWAVSVLSEQVIPATWGCKATSAKLAVATAVNMACRKLPMAEKQETLK